VIYWYFVPLWIFLKNSRIIGIRYSSGVPKRFHLTALMKDSHQLIHLCFYVNFSLCYLFYWRYIFCVWPSLPTSILFLHNYVRIDFILQRCLCTRRRRKITSSFSAVRLVREPHWRLQWLTSFSSVFHNASAEICEQ